MSSSAILLALKQQILPVLYIELLSVRATQVPWHPAGISKVLSVSPVDTHLHTCCHEDKVPLMVSSVFNIFCVYAVSDISGVCLPG